MSGALSIRYDQEGDILYIDRCPPYSSQDSEDLGDEIIARFNPETQEIENIEILFFSKRGGADRAFDLPIAAELRRLNETPRS
jgi:uncharacterized protein YuzE